MEHNTEVVGASGPNNSPLAPQLFALHERFIAERPPGAEEDVHMLPAIVEHVIERCSSPGDVVLDPFAGFGTTMDRAVAMGRQALGVELLPERVDYLKNRVPSAHIVEGDARQVFTTLRDAVPGRLDDGVELILTSPPYMTAEHHEADPLTGYEENDGDYNRYLHELGRVAAQCARLLVPGGFMVWNVADIYYRGKTTQLIGDCARVLHQHLSLVGITEIIWDQYPHDLVSDALLVFQRPPVGG
ncbi:MAG: TRM11 family SAM-dependent methyltransferase [Yaniella sp.]|uniref:TRM11 family SAM-dependent methyltransferase n=1 Tax=Yaniella sp. TaxID=2773929 RepID=UPI003F98F566